MNTVSFNRLQSRLIADEGLSIPYAAIMAENALYRFEPAVREGVALWLKGELKEDFTVGDVSIADVRGEIGGSLFQALCIMDIFAKDPDRVADAVWLIQEDRIYE